MFRRWRFFHHTGFSTCAIPRAWILLVLLSVQGARLHSATASETLPFIIQRLSVNPEQFKFGMCPALLAHVGRSHTKTVLLRQSETYRWSSAYVYDREVARKVVTPTRREELVEIDALIDPRQVTLVEQAEFNQKRIAAWFEHRPLEDYPKEVLHLSRDPDTKNTFEALRTLTLRVTSNRFPDSPDLVTGKVAASGKHPLLFMMKELEGIEDALALEAAALQSSELSTLAKDEGDIREALRVAVYVMWKDAVLFDLDPAQIEAFAMVSSPAFQRMYTRLGLSVAATVSNRHGYAVMHAKLSDLLVLYPPEVLSRGLSTVMFASGKERAQVSRVLDQVFLSAGPMELGFKDFSWNFRPEGMDEELKFHLVGKTLTEALQKGARELGVEVSVLEKHLQWFHRELDIDRKLKQRSLPALSVPAGVEHRIQLGVTRSKREILRSQLLYLHEVLKDRVDWGRTGIYLEEGFRYYEQGQVELKNLGFKSLFRHGTSPEQSSRPELEVYYLPGDAVARLARENPEEVRKVMETAEMRGVQDPGALLYQWGFIP